MPVLTPIPFNDQEILLMARMAFRVAQLGERGEDIPEQELEDAVYWVELGIEDIRAAQKYDPEAYAVGIMKNVLSEYAAAKLRGLDPFGTQSFLIVYQRWLRAAAQERYANRPNSWPEYPTVEQRLRNRAFGDFDPDGQTSADF